MKRLLLVPALVFAAAAFRSAERADEPVRYVIDRAHTNLEFVARHMLVSNVRGKFNEFEGEILLDEEDITRSSVRVTIDATSVDTDHERRDADLRSANFFETDRFPQITRWDRTIETGGLVVGEDIRLELNIEAATPR